MNSRPLDLNYTKNYKIQGDDQQLCKEGHIKGMNNERIRKEGKYSNDRVHNKRFISLGKCLA